MFAATFLEGRVPVEFNPGRYTNWKDVARIEHSMLVSESSVFPKIIMGFKEQQIFGEGTPRPIWTGQKLFVN